MNSREKAAIAAFFHAVLFVQPLKPNAEINSIELHHLATIDTG